MEGHTLLHLGPSRRPRVSRQFATKREDFTAKYAQACAYTPELVINAQGHVGDARVIDNDTKFGAFACCLTSIVREFTWPPSAAGAARTLAYPFTFELVDMRWYSSVWDSSEPDEYYYTSVKPEGFLLRLDGKMYGDTYDTPRTAGR